jgi:hypothetical protein
MAHESVAADWRDAVASAPRSKMTEVKLRRVAVPAPGQKKWPGETPASGSQEEPGEDPAAVD